MHVYFQSLLLSDPKRTFGQKYGHKSQPWQEILYCTFTICQRPLSFNMDPDEYTLTKKEEMTFDAFAL